MQATTREQQKAALAGCPVEYRELVTAHIKIARDRLRSSQQSGREFRARP